MTLMLVSHTWLSSLHHRYVRYDEAIDESWMWINRTDLTDGVGRHARRIASELECRGVYLGSWRIGCMLKACLLFMDIMIAEVREGRFKSSLFKSVFALVTLDVLKRKAVGETSQRTGNPPVLPGRSSFGVEKKINCSCQQPWYGPGIDAGV